jgi:hypothetical protein
MELGIQLQIGRGLPFQTSPFLHHRQLSATATHLDRMKHAVQVSIACLATYVVASQIDVAITASGDCSGDFVFNGGSDSAQNPISLDGNVCQNLTSGGNYGAFWNNGSGNTLVLAFYENFDCKADGDSTWFLLPDGDDPPCQAIGNVDNNFVMTAGAASFQVFVPFDSNTADVVARKKR